MPTPITDPTILDGYNSDALGYRGSPAGLFRPGSEDEIAEILRWCRTVHGRLTPVALRSSTTGSCVCHEGFLLSTERLQQVVDIRLDSKTVVVQPGKNLGELKRELEAEGLFFPPDPTSENDCTVGGAVACNASGARTLKYGPVRRWVRRLRVLLADGTPLELRALDVDKNAAGYFGFQDPIHFFIGSEGTLGVITEVELQCLSLPAGFVAFNVFFPSEESALGAAVQIRQRQWPVRCLEYFDQACLKLLHTEKGFNLPTSAGGMLFFEEEISHEGAAAVVESWLPRLEELGAAVDDTMVGDSRPRQLEMRELRHTIPSVLNERGIRYRSSGGLKMSSDWAVNYQRIAQVIPEIRDMCREFGVAEVYCFGHIGNGHPHFNLLAPDADKRQRARAAVHEMCRRIGVMGGTISAEHGIGKVKREYLPYCFPPQALAWMAAFKRLLDPGLILAPGNIFEKLSD